VLEEVDRGFFDEHVRQNLHHHFRIRYIFPGPFENKPLVLHVDPNHVTGRESPARDILRQLKRTINPMSGSEKALAL
jgi:hypothetical protein